MRWRMFKLHKNKYFSIHIEIIIVKLLLVHIPINCAHLSEEKITELFTELYRIYKKLIN